MLVKYSYQLALTRAGESYGDYQSELEDFKNFWRREHEHVKTATITMANGEQWIFYRQFGRGKWQRTARAKGTPKQGRLFD